MMVGAERAMIIMFLIKVIMNNTQIVEKGKRICLVRLTV